MSCVRGSESFVVLFEGFAGESLKFSANFAGLAPSIFVR